MVGEIITNEKRYSYNELIPKEFVNIGTEKYVFAGAKSENQPLGIVVCELINEKAVVLFFKIDQSTLIEPEEIANSLLQELERALFKKGIQYVFCFHDEYKKDNYFNEVLKNRGWEVEESQYEYLINPKRIVKPSVLPKLDEKFQLLSLEKIKVDELEILINQINKSVKTNEIIPLLESIDLSKSYFLVYQDKAIGWFIVNKNPNELEGKLLLSRFYVVSKFREYKVTIPFVKYALYQVHLKYKYKHIVLNVMKSNSKLNRIINNSSLVEVKDKKTVLRSFKKLDK